MKFQGVGIFYLANIQQLFLIAIMPPYGYRWLNLNNIYPNLYSWYPWKPGVCNYGVSWIITKGIWLLFILIYMLQRNYKIKRFIYLVVLLPIILFCLSTLFWGDGVGIFSLLHILSLKCSITTLRPSLNFSLA